MAKLKYYKYIESHGFQWALGIYQETEEELTAVEIGPVLQGLRLVMQGEQADVDTPIVKTSIELVFVDAPDLDEEKKCGYWEEFYTSSATEYVVVLRKANLDGTGWTDEWMGYITPDSFSEDLRYRGSVSIIARDGLGALQDFEFTTSRKEGNLISLEEILQEAWQVLPMKAKLDYMPQKNQSLEPIEQNGPYLTRSALFNVSAFRGKTWWEVVESVLYATGMVLRYEGGNTFRLRSIRQLGLDTTGYWWNTPVLDAQFCGYGHRELSPAAKSIKDEVSFEIEENIIDAYTAAEDYGEKTSYTYGENARRSMPVYSITSGLFGGTTKQQTTMLNPFAYNTMAGYSWGKGGRIQDPNILYIGANLVGRKGEYPSFKIQGLPAGSYKISMEINKAIAFYQSGFEQRIGYAYYDEPSWGFRYKAMFVKNDGTGGYTLIGTPEKSRWDEVIDTTVGHELSGNEFPYEVESEVLVTDGPGTLTVTLLGASLPEYPKNGAYGGYLGIANLKVKSIDNGQEPIMKELRITTEYNSKNNVVLTRSPELGINLSKTITPQMIRNALYVGDKYSPKGSDMWAFHRGDAWVPLSILIHQQTLAFHAKPNNILTGELRDAGGTFPDFRSIWRWNGKDHLLISGTLNILTGRMESAMLREFQRYDRMWETWIENEVEEIGSAAGRVIFYVHSAKTLQASDVTIELSWLTLEGVTEIQDGIFEVAFSVMSNGLDVDRQAIVQVDTAYAKIIQKKEVVVVRDYSEDYGSDYQ